MWGAHACGCRYYLNGADAFRLKLLLPLSQERLEEVTAQQLDSLGVLQSHGAG